MQRLIKLELTYITKHEHKDHTEIILVCRDERGNRHIIRVHDFEPYFYVPFDELDPEIVRELQQKGLVKRVEPTTLKSLDGRPVVKVVCYRARDVPEVRKYFKTTYEADVPFVVRFMIDKGIKNGILVPYVKEELSHRLIRGY